MLVSFICFNQIDLLLLLNAYPLNMMDALPLTNTVTIQIPSIFTCSSVQRMCPENEHLTPGPSTLIFTCNVFTIKYFHCIFYTYKLLPLKFYHSNMKSRILTWTSHKTVHRHPKKKEIEALQLIK